LLVSSIHLVSFNARLQTAKRYYGLEKKRYVAKAQDWSFYRWIMDLISLKAVAFK